MKRLISILLVLAVFSGIATAHNELSGSSINRFGMDLYQHLSIDNDENFSFSPASLYIVLGMVRDGAVEGTREEFDSVLHLLNESTFPRDVARALNVVPEISLANSIWTAPWSNLSDEYVDYIADFYLGLVETLDTDLSTSARRIND